MGFRNIIVTDRCKLEYSLNYLICRKVDSEKRILLDEIKMIIIDSTQVVITTNLLCKLAENKIKVIFCDEKHNPHSELTPYQNNYYSYKKIKEQINFINNDGHLWKKIIEMKIINQATNLKYLNKMTEYEMLMNYAKNVTLNDQTNREGHSAKVYFNALFGNGFSRGDDSAINKYLNYGYSIFLSAINREIKSLGYLTELGIHHIGESNSFNLSCDLIEPLRPLIDSLVIKNEVNDENFKYKFVELLSQSVEYNSKNIFLDNAIHLYVSDMIDFLKTNDQKYLKFITYEL